MKYWDRKQEHEKINTLISLIEKIKLSRSLFEDEKEIIISNLEKELFEFQRKK